MLNGKCLILRGVLGLGDMNIKSETQQFYLKKVGFYQPNKLKNAFILFNPQDKDKEKAFLSVNKEKEEINYSKLDYSLYQRWIFLPTLNVIDKNL